MELQGHRGARGVLPENSLPGFQYALAAGCDSLELDIAMSRDRRLVITHDPALNPDIVREGGDWVGERLAIKSLTLEQLQAYDIGRLRPGSDYALRFPQQKAIDGLRMPLLSDLMQLPEFLCNRAVRLDIEIKTMPYAPDSTFPPDEIADAVLQLIDQYSLRSRVRVRSFDWRGLMRMKRIAPDIELAFLTAEQPWLNNLKAGKPGKSAWLGGLDMADHDGSAAKAIRHLGGGIWAPYWEDLTSAALEQAHGLGLKVLVWTVNDEAAMRRMIAIGVDGFATDYPALGRRLIDEAAA